MAMTPYPDSNDNFENPSILVSENGYDFYEENDGINPLVQTPEIDHNDDPDIFFERKTNEFYLLYLETLRPEAQNLNILKSKDGLNWNKSTQIHYDLLAGDDFIVSPSMIRKADINYLFFVNTYKEGYPIQYYKTTQGTDWNKDSAESISVNFPDTFTPWHIDIFSSDDQYYMLINGFYNSIERNHHLYIAKSSDLLNWEVRLEPIIISSPNFYNSKMIYRSSGVVEKDLLVVWFSFQTNNNKWKIGVKKFNLNKLF